jgi:hypothetical protein
MPKKLPNPKCMDYALDKNVSFLISKLGNTLEENTIFFSYVGWKKSRWL